MGAAVGRLDDQHVGLGDEGWLRPARLSQLDVARIEKRCAVVLEKELRRAEHVPSRVQSYRSQSPAHALAVAGWMRYVTGRDESGKTIDVRDPLAAELAAIAAKAGPVADRLAPALLDVRSIFGDFGTDPRLRDAVTRALAQLYELGARRAVQAWRPV